MVGVTYGAVPLYRLFCQATGYGGTVQEGATVEAKLKARQEAKDAALEEACANRVITVFFNADVNDNLPWKFGPTQRSVQVRQQRTHRGILVAHEQRGTAGLALGGAASTMPRCIRVAALSLGAFLLTGLPTLAAPSSPSPP